MDTITQKTPASLVTTSSGAVVTEAKTHLVHVVEFDGESWRSNLAFRDALRADESLRAEYLRMKEQAVALAPQGRAKYNELKQSFFAHLKARTVI